ncbi:MAG TPA: PCP reductase family protein [Gemmatimonadales bacterium]|jgi:hypothetical protein|nr:PCP reductase family protein [Gemmatimonadales bacterium]
MKFLCIGCNEAMVFSERQEPGDGTFAAGFACPKCGHAIALLANPMETQLVGALGVKIGGRTLDQAPLEFVRSKMVGQDGAFVDQGAHTDSGQRTADSDSPGKPQWSSEAQARLERVPGFVRGMVKRIYTDYAVERRIAEITPDVMDRARAELGLEGM